MADPEVWKWGGADRHWYSAEAWHGVDVCESFQKRFKMKMREHTVQESILRNTKKNKDNKKLSYRKQIARNLRTQYVEGI